MTSQEIKNKLRNTKLFVWDTKVLTQVIDCLNRLGYQVPSKNPFIFIDNDDTVRVNNNPYVYTSSVGHIAITPEVIFDFFNYSPFMYASEVLQAIKQHGAWIKEKDNERLSAITNINASTVTIIRYGKLFTLSYNDLLDAYVFEDGTPIGNRNE